MIDLDALENWTDQQELYCYIGAAICCNSLSYARFRDLRDQGYLVSDKYINPSDRMIHPPLVSHLVQTQAKYIDVSWLYLIYLNISNIHCHYTEQEQIRILEILKEKSDDRMETML